jgi:hypothetical protein
MKVLISLLGLASFASIFIGTGIALIFGGFALAVKVLVASILFFIFFAIIDPDFK